MTRGERINGWRRGRPPPPPGTSTERNERRSNMMISDKVMRAVSTVTGSEVTGPVDE